MPYALVSSTASGSPNANSFTSASIDTSGASLLVIAVGAYYAVPTGTVSDAKGNTWTLIQTRTSSWNARLHVFYVANPTVGAAHTFTYTLAGNLSYASMAVAAFSGALLTTPFDLQTGTNSSGQVTSFQPGALLPSEANALVVTTLGMDITAGPDVTIDSGMTITGQVAMDSNHYGVALAYLVQTTAQSLNPTWSCSSRYLVGTSASFKAAAGAPSGKARPPYRRTWQTWRRAA